MYFKNASNRMTYTNILPFSHSHVIYNKQVWNSTTFFDNKQSKLGTLFNRDKSTNIATKQYIDESKENLIESKENLIKQYID